MVKVSGIILAGGKNSRMGKDKAFLLFKNKPLIEILLNKISGIFDELIIVSNNPLSYKKYNLRTEVDILKECGPLGGIYTGLKASQNEYNFVLACDMPFINLDLIKYMLKGMEDFDVVIPEDGVRLEPLFAVYSKTCIKPIEQQLSAGNLKVVDFLSSVKAKKISEEQVRSFDPERRCFVNINLPADYRRFANEQRI